MKNFLLFLALAFGSALVSAQTPVIGIPTGGGGGGISFPQTVAGTTNSGGIPYFSSATVLTSSAALTYYGVIYGGGAGGAPVSMAACGANFPVVGSGTAPACSTLGWLASATQWGIPYMSTATQMSSTAAITGFLYDTGSAAPAAATAAQLGTLANVAQYDVLLSAGTSSAITGIAPSATSGLPLLSQGSSTNPTYAALALSAHATQAANTVVMNNTGGSAAPTAVTDANANIALYETVATTLGDVVYGGASGTPSRLAGPTGGAGTYFVIDVPTTTAAVAETFSIAATGTGAPVLATSPTLVTPLLGTPTSGVITSLTGTCTSCVANSATLDLPLAGGTLTGGLTISSGGLTITNDGVHPNDLSLPWNSTANSAPTNATGWEGYVGSSGTAGWFDLPNALPAATSFMEFAAVGSAHSVGSMVGVTGTNTVVLNTSPALVTPALGAATATSLLATGIVDGTAPITITTGTTANLGATYKSGYTFNQEATAGTGVTYTLPATAVGLQYCVQNSGTTGVINIGVLTVYPPSSSYVILNGTVNTVGGGGTHGVASGGAAGDGACFVAIDATHWQVFPLKGTWTAN